MGRPGRGLGILGDPGQFSREEPWSFLRTAETRLCARGIANRIAEEGLQKDCSLKIGRKTAVFQGPTRSTPRLKPAKGLFLRV